MPEVLPRQFGKYTLLRALAAGGMAKVYLAIQRAVAGFEKLVVIKRILPELANDPAFVEMLLSEARTAATLNHPNIVQTFDVGEMDGTYYIAMEHINGEDIRSVVRAMRRAGVTQFPLEHTLSIVLGVCAGLAYAHEKRDLQGRPLGIVHRDISPQNVLITFSGDPKVVDFGIAKSNQAAVGENTAAGQLKGKVPYMSPEQASGIEIDHRSDIFAAGIMLFELTTSRRLFKAKSEYETLKLICEREYPKPSHVRADYPPKLEAIVMKALAKDREERYQSARDMQADLETYIRDERIATSAVSLGAWMKMLFEDKIEEQKEALQDVKELADVIASQRMVDTGEMYVGTTTDATAFADPSQTDIQLTPKRSRVGWVIAGAAVLVAGAAFFFSQSGGETTAAAPSSTGPSSIPSAALAKRGSLTINSEPAGAYIRIAGELQSHKTPATLDNLPLGIDLEVKLSLEGFEDHISTVEFSEDKLTETIDSKLTKGSATIEYTVIPKLAMVMLDGKPWKGKAGLIEGLGAGEHKLVFVSAGHIPQVVIIIAKKNETKKLNIVLRPGEAASTTSTAVAPPPSKGTGSVSVASRGGFCANTIVGGRSVGPTPTPPTQVPSGPVSVICKTADGRSIPSGTVVKPGGRTRVLITIPPK